MKVIPLSEGAFTVDTTKIFKPFNIELDQMIDRPKGSLLVEIQPFVVITSNDIIIIDTGLGFEASNHQLQILNNLSKHGINSSDVTKVLMSHLHKDHAGAILDKQGDFTFPNAKYYLQKREFEFASQAENPSYLKSQFAALEHHPQTVWLQDDHGYIDGYIQYQMTAAHSKFHQVFWIEENGEILFYGADDAPQYQQMLQRFAAKYDFDGKKAMNLRAEWKEKGIEKKWQFLFYHGIKNPTYTF
ncbi:MAG: MBL fold metallo-hydrolase [Chitinophagaceae bacterium]|nr:MAG: MBL fold metallo-hydrolase [Chitinophagaceae bacterium]